MKNRIRTGKLNQIKKFWLTFAAFFFGVAIVVAVFSLLANRNNENWLGTQAGLARENLFPYVFTENNDIYMLKEDLTVLPVDNGCENIVHDVSYDRVYYTKDGELYEYDTEKASRQLLCDGISGYRLFNARTDILTYTEDGGIYIYDFYTKTKTCLREAAENYIEAVCGDEYFAYFESGESSDNYSLYLCSLKGDKLLISEAVNPASGVKIFEDDYAISYYVGNCLKIYVIEGKFTESFENAYIVENAERNYNEIYGDEVTDYSDGISVNFLVCDVKEDGSSGVLTYIKKGSKKIETTEIDANCTGIIACDNENEIVVYRSGNGESFTVSKAYKAKSVKKLLTADTGLEITFMYDTASGYLYCKNAENNVTLIDTNDKNIREYDVAENVDSMYLCYGKPFAVFTSDGGEKKTIVLNKNEIETYSGKQVRLYGKTSTKYITYRTVNGSSDVSLDIAEENQFVRVSNSCSKKIAFDKTLENIIFWEEGKLKLYKNGEIVEICDFDYEITGVKTEAKSK